MSIIICPNCKSILIKSEKDMTCPNGHSFDISKEGYINLLLSNRKKKNNPGDNKLMLNAREDFLSKGHFDFLIAEIQAIVNSLDLLPQIKTINLLDLGCGTGFYTRNLFNQNDVNKIGIDISKPGIAKAAKSDNTSTYLVSSVFDLPIKENSIDIILNVFSPIHLEEIKRVLKPGGLLLKIIPTDNHMEEIASLVYEKFIPHQSTINESIESNPEFKIINVENLQRSISLESNDLHNFISMTPYLYKFSKAQLESLRELTVTLSFKIIIVQHGELVVSS